MMGDGGDGGGLFDDHGPSSNEDDSKSPRNSAPLAHLARPDRFEEFFGQESIFENYRFLKSENFPSIILWGPPGTGKTTLAHILAANSHKEIFNFNAVLGGVADLKKLISSAQEIKRFHKKESVIFIDEIHRFNKAQQDALLPYVEAGEFTLIGATTENPRRAINRALLSRIRVIELNRLDEEALYKIIENCAQKFKINISKEALEFIADYSNGDARNGLNILDVVYRQKTDDDKEIDISAIKKLVLENSRSYDRNQNRHYDVISAFIKSLRGSDPDAALLWLAVMIDGGEDPVFIARRLVILASEDIGNADPQALTLAVSTLTAVQNIGMPEARINLAQAVTYLASTVKSNVAYSALDQALEYVRERSTIDVPEHLKNYPSKNCDKVYKYPHSFPGHYVAQEYTIEKIPNFYQPTEMGIEKNIKERLKKLTLSSDK